MAACTLHQHWGMLKGAETLFKLATKAFAVKTTMCNEKALIHVITRSVVRGHSTTTWTTFSPILTTYQPSLGQLLTFHLPFVHVTKHGLPTFLLNCPRSYWMTSYYVAPFHVQWYLLWIKKKYNIYPLFYKVDCDKNWRSFFHEHKISP